MAFYEAIKSRYDSMPYRRCGQSGLKLPAVSLGLWQNFGDEAPLANSREMLLGAFDLGVTHFDLANNYGPAPGTAEETFGKILSSDLKPYRDELVISTKAGYSMWPGPYGEWGSKKNLTASLDQSLTRMRLSYVDIFYHHRPDPETPLEETAEALAQMVRQGKALYIGISNYSPTEAEAMFQMLRSQGVRCLIHQLRYNLLNRQNEGVFPVARQAGVGTIAFSPLAQGLLTDRYRNGIPADSRAGGKSVFLKESQITPQIQSVTALLREIAAARGQTLAQMALSWVLRRAASVLIGASSLRQIKENIGALEHLEFSEEELREIDRICLSGV